MMHYHVVEKIVRTALAGLRLDVFCASGGLAEELIAILPSPLVMGSAGVAAFDQGRQFSYLLWLAFLGALGKTLGAYFLYWISQEMEGADMRRFGSVFGISHERLEKIGTYFSRSWKDFFMILILRFLPVVPSTLLSAACGFFKTDKRDFLAATFFGSIVRNFLYLYLGFEGVTLYQTATHTGTNRFLLEISFFVMAGGLAILWLLSRKRNQLTK